jgi:hypothetical protein
MFGRKTKEAKAAEFVAATVAAKKAKRCFLEAAKDRRRADKKQEKARKKL